MKINCDVCGKEKEIKLYQYKRSINHFCSKECRHKYRIGKKRTKHSEESKAKISAANLGKKRSEEVKAKISASNKGKKRSAETKAKISACHKGKKLSEEHKAKIRASSFGKKHILGRKASAETKKKMSENRKGNKNGNWKGGKAKEITKKFRMRKTPEYKAWLKAVYERDKYTCQRCGDNKGGNLMGHHLKAWEPNKKLRYVIINGITLCERCHVGFIHTKKARVLNPYEIGQGVLEL